MTEDLLLFPFGGNAREALGVVHAINEAAAREGAPARYRAIGFVDDDPTWAGTVYRGVPVVGRALLAELPHAKLLACVGSPSNFRRRDGIIASLGLPRERFATLVHPSVVLGLGVVLGVGVLLQAGVVVTSDVRIGDHVVVLPNTVISHDAVIEELCLVGSNVSISGGAVVERSAYVGSGARILQGIRIGAGTLVGLGAVVIRSTEPGSTVAGVPARPLAKGGA